MGRFLNADAFASTGQGILGNNMFAYCGNNPVNYSDPAGYSARFATIALDMPGSVRDYITDQNKKPIAKKKFGIATVSHGGCGVVASYNALISLGAGRDFDDVLAYYNNNMSYANGWGLLGLSTRNVADYFLSLGYIVVVTDDASFIDMLSATADACIVYYEFPRKYPIVDGISIDAYGAHFVEYHKSGGGYVGMNTNGINGVTYFPSPYEFGYYGTQYYAEYIFIFKSGECYQL